MIFYHSTTEAAAQAILTEGFRDARGTYGFLPVDDPEFELVGVWVSEQPVDVNEGAKGDVVLSIDLDATESELADHEIEEMGWCSWCLPAKLVNTGRIALVIDRTDLDDVLERRFLAEGGFGKLTGGA